MGSRIVGGSTMGSGIIDGGGGGGTVTIWAHSSISRLTSRACLLAKFLNL